MRQDFGSISGTHSETRVRFEAVQLQAHESEITLKYNGNRIDVHLGFLQVNRHYNVTFVMQDDLGEDLTFDPLQNLHARIIDYAPTEDGIIFPYNFTHKSSELHSAKSVEILSDV